MKNQRKRRRLQFQALENRKLMAVDLGDASLVDPNYLGDLSLNRTVDIQPSAYVDTSGELRVQGSNQADEISVNNTVRRSMSWTGSSWQMLSHQWVMVTVQDPATSDTRYRGYFDPDDVTRMRINANNGNDVVRNYTGLPSTIDGGLGADTLTGGSGSDTIRGGDQDDTLIGGDGSDYLYGQNHNDTLYGDHQGISVRGGNDYMWGGNGADELRGGSGDDYMVGGDLGDTMFGEAGNDRMYGNSGMDTIDGGLGNDRILGGDDNDTLFGGSGRDYIYGQNGDDRLRGDDNFVVPGAPVDDGNPDNDVFYGGYGQDTIHGNAGADWLFGEGDEDQLHGGVGNDWIIGGNGDDQLLGEDGEDHLYGQNDNDFLDGGNDTDWLYGGNGRDMLDGGGGDFTDYLNGNAGNDTLRGRQGADTLRGGDGDDLLEGGAGADHLFGDNHNDTLYGNDGEDHLDGGGGNDGLYGGRSVDFLRGGTGADRFLNHGDVVEDRTDADARINFVGTPQGWYSTLGGIRYVFAANWTPQEIELVDQAFGAAMARTGNADFLKMPNGDDLTFQRVGRAIWPENADVGGVNFLNGTIGIGQGAFDLSDTWVIQTVLHELGHNWHGNPLFGAFRDAHNNSTDTEFVTDYARTNAEEDFGEMVAFAMIDWANQNMDDLFWTERDFRDDADAEMNNDQVRADVATKLALIDEFFESLSS